MNLLRARPVPQFAPPPVERTWAEAGFYPRSNLKVSSWENTWENHLIWERITMNGGF